MRIRLRSAALAAACTAGACGVSQAASQMGRIVATDVGGGMLLGALIGWQAGLIPYGQSGNGVSGPNPFGARELVIRGGYGALAGAGVGFFVGIYESRVNRPMGSLMARNVFGGQIVGSAVGALGSTISYMRTGKGSDFTSGVGVGGLAGAAVGLFLTFYEAAKIAPGAEPFMGRVVGTDVAGGIVIGSALGLSAGLIAYGGRGNSNPRGNLILPLGWGSIAGAALGLAVGMYEVTAERPIGPLLGENVGGGILLGAALGCVGASLSYLKTKRGSDFTVGAGAGALVGAVAGGVLAFYESAAPPPGSRRPAAERSDFALGWAAPEGAAEGFLLVGSHRF